MAVGTGIALLLSGLAGAGASVAGAKIASDYYTCRVHRKEMEAQGIKFAPVDVAVEFSTELTGHEWPSLGYHGRNSQPHKHQTGWKLIEKLENQIPIPGPVPNENRSSISIPALQPARV